MQDNGNILFLLYQDIHLILIFFLFWPYLPYACKTFESKDSLKTNVFKNNNIIIKKGLWLIFEVLFGEKLLDINLLQYLEA